MARCCCTPQINDASNRVIAALSRQNQIIPQQLPQKVGLDFSVDDIARRVADYLNPVTDTFERDVLRQLEAISNALIGIQASQANVSLLNRIIRNTNDIFDLQVKQGINNQANFDKTATKAQAKDLLFAVTDGTRKILDRLSVMSRYLTGAFAVVGAAIAAVGLFARLTAIAEKAAKIIQTGTILRAIAALKFPETKVDLSGINRKLDELIKGILTLDLYEYSVPSCEINALGEASIVRSPASGYGLKDAKGQSTKAGDLSVTNMIADLLEFGQIECGGGVEIRAEVIAQIDSSDLTAGFPRLWYPLEVQPMYFTLQFTDVNPAVLRTYKLGGEQSEYGAGNWSLVDESGRCLGDFTRIYNGAQRLEAPKDRLGTGIRLSLKPGISAILRAHGTPNQ